jgi:hypothetical protein
VARGDAAVARDATPANAVIATDIAKNRRFPEDRA